MEWCEKEKRSYITQHALLGRQGGGRGACGFVNILQAIQNQQNTDWVHD